MNEKTREALRGRLERLRENLLATGPAKFEPTRKDAAQVGVPDEDEQALTEMLQILASSQNRKQSEELGLIDRALRKLSESPGDYGLCEECDEEIAPRRLELMPYVTLCTECQAARDPRRGSSRKSLTDYRD
jgi:DnaK suppressor protein